MIIISASALITKDDTVLLVHETKTDKWGLPGGKLEAGETIRECVVRECLEEIGQKVEVTQLVMMSQKPHSREGNNVVRFIYEAQLAGSMPDAQAELDYAFVNQAEFERLSNQDLIRGKDVAALVTRFYEGLISPLPEPEQFT